MGAHSTLDLSELSYNERKIIHELLKEEQSSLRTMIVQAQARLEFVDDLVERTDEQENK
jgi:hypothetical protein